MRQHRLEANAYCTKLLQRELKDLYTKMERDLAPLPDEIENDDQMNIVRNIWSIEEEWVLDPKQREDMTLVNKEVL